MNKHFAELAKKAGFVYIADEGIGWASNYNASLEKFAELIVRECLNNMQNCDGDLDFAIFKTKRDFGVES